MLRLLLRVCWRDLIHHFSTEERQEEETEVCGRQAAADEKEQPGIFFGCLLSII